MGPPKRLLGYLSHPPSGTPSPKETQKPRLPSGDSNYDSTPGHRSGGLPSDSRAPQSQEDVSTLTGREGQRSQVIQAQPTRVVHRSPLPPRSRTDGSRPL